MAPGLDRDSFERAFEEWFAAVHRYIARRLSTPLADDLAAETFAIAFARRATFDPARGTIRAWLYGIATNLVRSHWRVEIRSLQLDAKLRVETILAEQQATTDEALSAAVVMPRLAAALADLKREQREVLLLHAWADLTNDEIASALDIPAGTVRSRLYRARQSLWQELRGFDFDLWVFADDEPPARKGPLDA